MRTKSFLGTIIFHLLITSVSAESIPFRLLGKLIVIEAEVNNQKGYFILDTGISELILNEKYFSGYRSYSEKLGQKIGFPSIIFDIENVEEGVEYQIDNESKTEEE